MSLAVLVGTRKGLFVLRGDESRRSFEVEGPLLTGWQVFHTVQDRRDGALYAAANNWVYGGTVQRSTDLGQTWERSEQLALPEESGLELKETWHVEPGRDSEPGRLWLGAAPGALFRSDDSGASWEPVQGILEHPTRERWQPGAGGMCTHSIQLDPADTDRIWVAISAAGAFRSEDGGETWEPANQNVAADFLPEKYPEVGQCVHKLLTHPDRPDRLWQQNHCGVYRSDDAGRDWERLDGNGLPSDFGFPIGIHPRDPDTAWVVPQEGAENRVTCDGRVGIYRTRDGGASWEVAANGLPNPGWASVLREAMTVDSLDPAGVYFGTESGSVFVSPSEGDDWVEAASQLPPVLSLEIAEWR